MGRSAVKASGFLSSYFREKEGFDVEQQVGSRHQDEQKTNLHQPP